MLLEGGLEFQPTPAPSHICNVEHILFMEVCFLSSPPPSSFLSPSLILPLTKPQGACSGRAEAS